MNSERTKLIASFILGLVVMAAAFLALGGDAATDTALDDEIVTSGGTFADTDSTLASDAVGDDVSPVEETTPDEAPAGEATHRFSDLPAMSPADLPPEALDTLSFIASGGPYPFDKDDSTFQNREGFLPDHPIGHYREYTVVTPGASNRGARRIVAGADGELYYTSDHYASFSEIVLGS